MNIFSLLGFILDSIINENEIKKIIDDDTVKIELDGANTYIPQAVDDDKVILYFRYNSKYNNRGELFLINIIASNGLVKTYEVAEGILSEISTCGLDEIYFQMCEEIML